MNAEKSAENIQETTKSESKSSDSMEDILHSIRDIISSSDNANEEESDDIKENKVNKDETPKDEIPKDETPEDETPEDETPENETPKDETPEDETPEDETPEDETPEDETPEDETPEDETPENETPEDEIFELTDIVEPEKKSITETQDIDNKIKEQNEIEAMTEETETNDVLNEIDDALEEETLVAPPAPPIPQAEKPQEVNEHLVSDEVASKATESIQDLMNNIPKPEIKSPDFRGGTTVEELVIEALKPMLSEWLDDNLSVIVKQLVEQEIKKIIPQETRD